MENGKVLSVPCCNHIILSPFPEVNTISNMACAPFFYMVFCHLYIYKQSIALHCCCISMLYMYYSRSFFNSMLHFWDLSMFTYINLVFTIVWKVWMCKHLLFIHLIKDTITWIFSCISSTINVNKAFSWAHIYNQHCLAANIIPWYIQILTSHPLKCFIIFLSHKHQMRVSVIFVLVKSW